MFITVLVLLVIEQCIEPLAQRRQILQPAGHMQSKDQGMVRL